MAVWADPEAVAEMMRWARVIALAGLVALHAPDSAAQMACGSYDRMQEQLIQRYEEARVGRGLGSSTVLIEVWASETTGTWTILKVYTTGMACVMASGEGWEIFEPEIPGTPI